MTKIEWVKNPDNRTQGMTWNPITGCLNECPYCFARKLANTRLRERYLDHTANVKTLDSVRPSDFINPFYPRFWPDKLDIPMKRKKPTGYFVCDMSDWVGIGIPSEWSWGIMETIVATPQHRYYTLTKQPQNLLKFSPFPENCWVGVSTPDQPTLTVACDHLATIKASVKFLSFEPLLGDPGTSDYLWQEFYLGKIDWVIIGEQTPHNQKTTPRVEWVSEIIEAADKIHIPVFVKEPLASHLNIHREEMPEVRQ